MAGAAEGREDCFAESKCRSHPGCGYALRAAAPAAADWLYWAVLGCLWAGVVVSPPQGSCLSQGDSDPCETKPQVIVLAAGLENKCNPGEKVKVKSQQKKNGPSC